MLDRPDSTEYAEYYKSYIARVPDGPLTDFLAQQAKQYRQLLGKVSPTTMPVLPLLPGSGVSNRC